MESHIHEVPTQSRLQKPTRVKIFTTDVLDNTDFIRYQFIFTTVLTPMKAILVIIFTAQAINKKKTIKAAMHVRKS